ncbi:shikimate kinase [Paludibacter sp. 221]|uniref:shikimate kinase n=1 Tax=Paludibacter sp. 221 TaxID=2302939 RepID=UPI0013D18A5A|nr:shikimate kinase [Paludibacter sp. 221]NDV47677.1 shikimate kinase [Paludibacter sp. 221]
MSRYFLIGFMACGKTTIGKAVAEKMGFGFVDLDKLIESEHNKTVSEIFAEQGEEAFRKLENEYLKKLISLENTIIATGGGVPCFFNNMELMNEHGKTFYLKFAPEELKTRIQISSQNSRPLVAGKSDEELLHFVSESLKKREHFYNQATYTVYGNDNEIAEQIIALINRENE